MQYSEYHPSDKINFLVKRFLFLHSKKNDKIFKDKFIPDWHSSLVLNFFQNVTVSNNSLTKQLPPLFLVPPLNESLYIEAKAPLDTMVVIFNSTIFSRLFNFEMDKDPEMPYKIIDPFGQFPMMEKLSRHTSPKKRIKIFENFLLENVLTKEYVPDPIDKIYKKIIDLGGKVSINDLANENSINERSLRRNFIKRTGLSAKSLSRIVRINLLWEELKKSPDADLHHLIFEYGYYDQAHFINDFKKIIGESPHSFFGRDLEQVKFLSGKS